MSKGSGRRPTTVDRKEFERRWDKAVPPVVVPKADYDALWRRCQERLLTHGEAAVKALAEAGRLHNSFLVLVEGEPGFPHAEITFPVDTEEAL